MSMGIGSPSVPCASFPARAKARCRAVARVRRGSVHSQAVDAELFVLVILIVRDVISRDVCGIEADLPHRVQETIRITAISPSGFHGIEGGQSISVNCIREQVVRVIVPVRILPGHLGYVDELRVS
jgi:hypothetical protein